MVKKILSIILAVTILSGLCVFAQDTKGFVWKSWDDKSREVVGQYKVESYSYIENMIVDRNYRVDFTAEITDGDNRKPAVYIRADKNMNGYRLQFYKDKLSVERVDNGAATILIEKNYDYSSKSFYIMTDGDTLSVGSGDNELISITENESVDSGFFAADCADGKLVLSDIKITAVSNPEDDYYRANPSMDYKKSRYIEDIKKIKALGFMTAFEDGSFKPFKSVTRAELALIITRMMNSPVKSAQYAFKDIDSSFEYYKACAFSVINGWMDTEDGAFYPERNATYEEAVRALVLISGRIPFDVKDEYAYFKLANEAGITAGVNEASVLTRELMAHLSINTAECELMYMSQTGDRIQFSTAKDKTILSEYHNIYALEGRVTYTEISGLYSAAGCRDGAVVIDGYLVETGTSDISDYLGWYVEFYGKLNEDKETYTMLYFEQIERRNRPLTVDALNIEPGTNVQEFFYTDGRKTEKLSLPTNLIYLYNGGVVSPADGYLKPEVGSVTFIFNNGELFAATIKSFDTMIVGSVSYTTGEIYDKYFNKTITLDSEQCSYTIFSNGKKISLTSIYQNSVLNVAQSPGTDKHYTVYASQTRVNGVLQAEDSSSPYNVTIEGNEYKTLKYGRDAYNANSVKRPIVGEKITAYLDYNGNIALMISEALADNYGYLIKIANSNKMDGKYIAAIFTAGGELITPYLAGTVKLDNIDTDCRNALPAKISTAQLIEFRCNSKGLLVEINTAQSGSYGSAPLVLGQTYSNTKYVSSNHSLDSKAYVDWKTTVIIVPQNPDELEEYASVKREYFKDGKTYTVNCYNVNDFDIPEFIVLNEGSVTETVEKLPRAFVFDHISKALAVDGEEYTALNGFYKGKTSVLRIKDGKESVFASLQKGDAIFLMEDARGNVSNYSLIYSASSGQIGSNNPLVTLSADKVVVAGKVVKLDRTERRVRIDVGNGTVVEKAYYMGSVNATYAYNASPDLLELSSFSNLDVGDFVVCNYSWGRVNDLIIYKD